jgi:hypothetical protein
VFDVNDFAASFMSDLVPATPADTSPPTVPGKATPKLTNRTLALRIGPFTEAVSGTVAVTSRPLKANAAVVQAAAPKRLRIKLGPKPFQVAAGQVGLRQVPALEEGAARGQEKGKGQAEGRGAGTRRGRQRQHAHAEGDAQGEQRRLRTGTSTGRAPDPRGQDQPGSA